jgi:prevent-host-death family protein
MREVQASEAKTRLPELLSSVERGETILIRRHGRAIARIVPEKEIRQAEIDRAVEEIRALRSQGPGLSVEEILSARDEGRKG